MPGCARQRPRWWRYRTPTITRPRGGSSASSPCSPPTRASRSSAPGCGRSTRPAASSARERRSRAGDVGSVLLRFNPIPNSSAAFRREPALALGGYDPRYRYAPDHDLWLRLAERHRVVALDEELSTRVMGGENVAARAERAQIAEALAIRARALRRRRTLRGAGGLVRPAISYLVPIRAKRALRTLRGQAP